MRLNMSYLQDMWTNFYPQPTQVCSDSDDEPDEHGPECGLEELASLAAPASDVSSDVSSSLSSTTGGRLQRVVEQLSQLQSLANIDPKKNDVVSTAMGPKGHVAAGATESKSHVCQDKVDQITKILQAAKTGGHAIATPQNSTRRDDLEYQSKNPHVLPQFVSCLQWVVFTPKLNINNGQNVVYGLMV